MNSLEKIQLRVRLRKQVQELFELIGPPESDEFWTILAEEAAKKSGTPVSPPGNDQPKVEPMTGEQARSFEKVLMPFGIYVDLPVGKIPFDYLCRLVDPSPFMEKLKAYVAYQVRHEPDHDADNP